MGTCFLDTVPDSLDRAGITGVLCMVEPWMTNEVMEVKKMKFRTPRHGDYYDLIEVPSGHIPTPMARLWKFLPLPVCGQRTQEFFECPFCHEKSFFSGPCGYCEPHMAENDAYYFNEEYRSGRKKIEYIFLPILVLFGKAGYIEA